MEVLSPRVKSALDRAQRDALKPVYEAGPRAEPARRRVLAMGDPQAPLEKLLTILDQHGVLGETGRLREEVHLVSIGDHFDWGAPPDREAAAMSALRTVSWLAAHPSDQVTLIVGNHDLARVGELVGFDDRLFSEAQREADALYPSPVPGSRGEEAFSRRFPQFPSAEAAARDFCTFKAAQRGLVASLLKARRFSAALGTSSSLLCHAGVTREDLLAVDVGPGAQTDARAVAAALNHALDEAVRLWDGATAFGIPLLHVSGSAATGEARGMFCHRPSDPAHDLKERFVGPPRRRFDPRDLPRGLTQVVGHIRDAKCRELMRDWALPPGGAGTKGSLRHLTVRWSDVHYREGLPPREEPDDSSATLIFIDGGMNNVPAEAYELLEVTSRRVAPRPGGAA